MTEEKSKPLAAPVKLADFVEYADGSVVSREVIKKDTGNVTLFAFDAGQGLSEHTAPFDAMVHVLDGEAEIFVGGERNLVGSGEAIIMPANVPHSLNAVSRFKMALIMIKAKS